MIDRRKGSEKEVKNKRKEPNGTKGPRAVKSEEIAVESEDEAERQCSLSSISDSQDDVRQVEKRKVKRASRSRTRGEHEKRELHEVDPLAEIRNLEMQRSMLINHAICQQLRRQQAGGAQQLVLIERALNEIEHRSTNADLHETQLICHEVRKTCEQRYKEDEEEIESQEKQSTERADG